MNKNKLKEDIATYGPTAGIIATGVALSALMYWGQHSRDVQYANFLGELLSDADDTSNKLIDMIADKFNKE